MANSPPQLACPRIPVMFGKDDGFIIVYESALRPSERGFASEVRFGFRLAPSINIPINITVLVV